jgi:hypothetical protein
LSAIFPETFFDAGTIAASITNNWSLSGLLALAQNVDPTITEEGVWVFAHQNPEGIGRRIVVLVRSITTRPNTIEHPMFSEVRQAYEVWCHYILENIDETNWINAESLIQSMQDEVLRILRLSYDPWSQTCIFFTTNRKWENKDDFTQASPQINRVLTFELTMLQSRTTSVPKGYGGILVFDGTHSDGNGLPSSYQYTEAYHVEYEEGWDTVEEVVSPPSVLPMGVPIQFTGKFAGFFQCELYPKVADFGDTTNCLNMINQLLVYNTSGQIVSEIPRVTLIQSVSNTASPPNKLSDTITIRPTRVFRVYDQEKLVPFRLVGKAYKPSNLVFQ